METQCIQLMQMAAKSLVEAGTKDGGFQVGKPWVPPVKDDEDGQNQREYHHLRCSNTVC